MSHPSSPARGGPALGANSNPTPYPDLNAVLAETVASLRTLLGDNLVGAYLQGSFAVGDFDERSDVDFMVVTGRDLTEAQLPALQAMHARIHRLPSDWARRLEGSYAPKAVLRRLAAEPRDPPDAPPRPADWADPGTSGRPPRFYPLLYLGNGHEVLVRSEHDNSQVVRWVLREKGVRLWGPHPRTLIDPVTPAALRAEVAETLRFVAGLIEGGPAHLEQPFYQRFFVLLFARILQSLSTGAVGSKKAAVAWAAEALPPRWRPLIEDAWVARSDPGVPGAARVAETRAFVAFAVERAATAPPPNPVRTALERRLARQSQARGGARPDWRSGARGPGPGGGHRGPPPTRPGGRGRRG
jgi:predicted nucleotidyltransferase